jgi:hypothetical protein
LNVPNGAVLAGGANVVAHGAINGRIAVQLGTTIVATGDLSLGDPASDVGFVSAGELVVNDHTVTLRDANAAALGSLTSLGDGGAPGTLIVQNGLLVEPTGNVAGFGAIQTLPSPAAPLTNNGAIVGDSLAEPITIAGYARRRDATAASLPASTRRTRRRRDQRQRATTASWKSRSAASRPAANTIRSTMRLAPASPNWAERSPCS